MRMWIVQETEPYPFEQGVRLWRDGMLALELAKRGHDVTWWGSIFSHSKREFLFRCPHVFEDRNGITYRLMDSMSYRSNFDVQRYLNLRYLARQFRHMSRRMSAPDLLLANIPNYFLAEAGVDYCLDRRTQCVVDARDPWPDSFLSYAPVHLRPLVGPIAIIDRARVRRAIGRANATVAISESMAAWAQGYASEGHAERRGGKTRVFYVGSKSARTRPKVGAPQTIRLIFAGTFANSIDFSFVEGLYTKLQASLPPGLGVELHLAGDGERCDWVCSRFRGMDGVTMHGWVDEHRLRELLDDSDIGLAPYGQNATQSLPNKPFEYLAHGLHVVSTLRGELPAILEDHGVGVSCEDLNPDKAVKYILNVLQKSVEERLDLKRRAVAVHSHHFDSETIYSRYADFLESQADECPPKSDM